MARRPIQIEHVDTRELPDDEVFVYDRQQRVTHHLSHEVALVWEKCDGRNGRSDLERIVRAELNISEAKETVRDAIMRLNQLKLLR
jgi:hypothetical protein